MCEPRRRKSNSNAWIFRWNLISQMAATAAVFSELPIAVMIGLNAYTREMWIAMRCAKEKSKKYGRFYLLNSPPLLRRSVCAQSVCINFISYSQGIEQLVLPYVVYVRMFNLNGNWTKHRLIIMPKRFGARTVTVLTVKSNSCITMQLAKQIRQMASNW